MAEHEWEDLAGQILLGRYTLRSLLSARPGQAEYVAYAAAPGEKSEPLSVTLIVPDEVDFEQQLGQIQTAQRLVHHNLLRVLDGRQCTMNGTSLLFVVTETAAVTLAEVVSEGPLDSAEGTALIKDLVGGLNYIHGSGFVCGSLEPETIVHAGDVWKIGDLSQLHRLSTFDNGIAADSKTPAEASVEGLEYGMDTRALGAILSASLAEDVRRIPVFQEIIAGCLESDPAKRLSTEEISRLLESPQASDVGPPKAPSAGQPGDVSGRRVLLTLAVVVFAALLLFAVLAKVAFRKLPAPAPAKSAVARVPARTVLQPESRPSPFSSNRDTTSRPAPQPHLPPSVSAPSPPPQPQPASKAESAARSVSQDTGEGDVGRANFFADSLVGQRTASGELFSNQAMTAAHASLPFGTKVRVTNLKNNKSVQVRVNDRLPPGQSVTITVTRAAAEQLGFMDAGFARVRVEPVR